MTNNIVPKSITAIIIAALAMTSVVIGSVVTVAFDTSSQQVSSYVSTSGPDLLQSAAIPAKRSWAIKQTKAPFKVAQSCLPDGSQCYPPNPSSCCSGKCRQLTENWQIGRCERY